MFQVLLILQVLIMNWYITKIVFNIHAENSTTRNQFDEQLRLVQAENAGEAFLKARTLGLNEEEIFYNDQLKQVKWEFVNVSEVLALKELHDGTEIYSQIHEADEAVSYIHVVHQKAIAIRLKEEPLLSASL